MKLRESNNVIQKLIEDSLRELSNEFNKKNNINSLFSFWINTNFLDKDKNICVRGVLDFSVWDEEGKKVRGFKKLLDRALVLRENINFLGVEITNEKGEKVGINKVYNTESPKYGKQLGYEELRRKILHEVVGKGVAGLALSLENLSKEQIEEFNFQEKEV